MAQGNVVLIAFYDLDSFTVRTLHAVLKRAGVPVTSIFFKPLHLNNTMEPASEADIDALIGELRRLNPILVGLSVRSTYFQLAARVSQRIKAALDTFVLWGGVHVTIRPEDCLAHADGVCIGEGEDLLLELTMALNEGRSPGEIHNLWVKCDGEVIRNPQRALIANLDTVPPADFLNEDKIFIDDGCVQPVPDAHGRLYYWLMTSRGCPYSCTYCCNNILRDIFAGQGSYVRRRSVAHVIEELRLARHNHPGIQFIVFMDDLFTFNVRWLREFKDVYKREIGIPFFCYCHPRTTSDETIGLLREAGAVSMAMGIQSGSQRVRREYFKRNDTNEDILQAARIFRKHGLLCAYDIIMDNPLENETDRRETLDLLLCLPRPFELHTHSLTHFPETDLTRLLLERGMIQRDDVEDRKQMSYERWTPSLDLRRDRENLFWDNLYYMASKRSIPAGLIRWLSRRSLLRRWPQPLTLALRLTSNYVQTVRDRSKLDKLRVQVVGRLLGRLRRLREKLARP